ncbi:YfjI family protein [Streptomyces sp. NPDC127084]|uniref:YfjI family protein n=1 Tax=Streptomyces sp. NPDC127084 TaxID=3347133 RepID=UPI00365AEF05
MTSPGITEAPTADAETIRSWLGVLYGHADGHVSITSDHDNFVGRRFPATDEGLDAATEYALELDRHKPKGIYAQTTTLRELPPPGKRGGEDLAHVLTYIWADGDYGTIGHKPGLDDLPHPPTPDAVVKVVEDSGLPVPTGWGWSGGGGNPVWLLAEAHTLGDADDRAQVKKLTTDVQAILGAAAYRNGWCWDTQVGNLDRLMKLIGTVNRKPGCPERPTALGESSGAVYSLDELIAVVDQLGPQAHETLALAAKEKEQRRAARLGMKVPAPRAIRPQAQRSELGGPFDVLQDMASWADILEPAGFTFEGTHSDGREKWLRPASGGDRPSSPYSLLCNDYVAINWSDRSDLPVGKLAGGEKLTKGTVFAHLHYGGNRIAAGEDLMRAAAGKPCLPAARSLSASVLSEIRRRCQEPRQWPTRGQNPPPTIPRNTGHSNSGDSGGTNQGQEEWDEPISIDPPPLPKFPVTALGTELATIVNAVSEAYQVPVDMPALTVLGAISAAIGGRRNLHVMPGWTETTSLWAVPIAGPSELKSPMLRYFAAPIKVAEKVLREAAEPEIEMQEQERRINEARMAQAEKKAATAADKSQRDDAEADASEARRKLAEIGETRVAPRILFGDITPEAAQVRAAEHGGRIAVLSAEGTLFEILSGLYSQGRPNINFFLNAYSGDVEPTDRITRASRPMDAAHVALALVVQPAVLEGLGRQHNKALRGKGLLARFLYGYPTSLVGSRNMRPTQVPDELTTGYQLRMTSLVEQVWDTLDPTAMVFTTAATDALIEFRSQLEPRLAEGGDLHSLGDWAGKLHGQCARIAALLTLYTNPHAQRVDIQQVHQAVQMAPYLIAHARRVYDLMGRNRDAELSPARDLLAWLRRRQKPEADFSERDAWQAMKNGKEWAETADDVKDAIRSLEDYGWVAALPQPEREQGQRGRSKSPRFIPHPWVYAPPAPSLKAA